MSDAALFEAAGAGGRHDVCAASPCQEEIAVTHRLRNERAQRRNGLSIDAPVISRRHVGRQGGVSAHPRTCRPTSLPRCIAQRHLDVVTAQHLRTQRKQSAKPRSVRE